MIGFGEAWIWISRVHGSRDNSESFFFVNHILSFSLNYSALSSGAQLLGSFTLARKVYDNHLCNNKPQTGNGAGVWMTSCPVEMVLRIWGFWKRVSWELTLDHGGRELSFCHSVEKLRLDLAGRQLRIRPLSQGVEFFGTLLAEMNWDLKHHEMCRTLRVGLA